MVDCVRLFEEEGKVKLATLNLTPGLQAYGEKLISAEGREYRLWSPYRSKLSAAMLNGLTDLPLGQGSVVLYLGAASGTTASHVSDIVGYDGTVFCIDFAPRPMKELLRLSETRGNIVPLLADARRPATYAQFVSQVDFMYQDVAQPRQGEIFRDNAHAFLSPGGRGILMLKSRSVDVAREPEDVYRQEQKQLSDWGFEVVDSVPLLPYDKDHLALLLRMHRPTE